MTLGPILRRAVCLVTQLCLILCGLLDCNPPGSSVHGDPPGKNTGGGGHALLQGILPTQGSNPGLPHCRWILYCLSHQGEAQEYWSGWLTTSPGNFHRLGIEPGEGNGNPFQYSCGRRSLVGCCPEGCTGSDMTEAT